jgi:hypothetical protein
VLIGDSHVKGFATALQTVLSSECELLSVVKPGASSSHLVDTITKSVKQLSKEDIFVIGSGTNDYQCDNFKSTFINFKNYLTTLSHTNVLVLGIPWRYDLHNSIVANSEISQTNRKLFKLTRYSPNIRFLEANDDSELFTKHGLHRNKLGKQQTVSQIASYTFSLFRTNTQTSIPLEWQKPIKLTKGAPVEIQDDNRNVNLGDSQRPSTLRNTRRLLKTPVTRRSEDFLW